MFKNFAKGFVVARTVSALNSLDDRQLAMIGVRRTEIREHAEKING